VTFRTVASGFSQPVDLAATADPDDSERVFVVEKGGTIQILDADGGDGGTFLDISGLVITGGEQGLLGLAFHPDYETNGFFYVYHTNAAGNNVLARYTRDTDTAADPGSRVELFTIAHPTHSNHNGGALRFGGDGNLYLGTGDGGGGGDPFETAQDPDEPRGKILRVTPEDSAPYYSIPAGNPYDSGGGDERVYHSGLRNPWRIGFDPLTGGLYIGDVGQGAREEIDTRSAAAGPANFGWDCYEGTNVFESAGCGSAGSYRFPDFQYGHESGRCSVTGGEVARQTSGDFLYGHYFFGDFCGGDVWTLESTAKGAQVNRIADTDQNISTFGRGPDGALYMATFGGTVYEVESSIDETPPAGTPAGTTALYRFYSPKRGNAHFYTLSKSERDQLLKNDNDQHGGSWRSEGVTGFLPPTASGTCSGGREEVYRFYSSRFQSHFYTVNEAERNHLQTGDPNWKFEGAMACAPVSAVADSGPLYRFWSPRFRKHFFTASLAERNALLSDQNWDPEGSPFRVFK
jgi:hypothetical protein